MNQTMFPIGTTLRYYPEASERKGHYTALVKDREIVEVKRAGETVRQSWGSIDEWLDSIPGSPSIEDLVTDKREEVVDEVKEPPKADVADAVAKKKSRKRTFKLPPARDHVPATRFTIHVYRMIKEAQPLLLKDPAVIVAFEELIRVLTKHQFHINSFIPRSNRIYLDGVKLDTDSNDPMNNICEFQWEGMYRHPETGRWVIRSRYYRRQEGPSQEEKEVREEVTSVYRVLYDLIQADVIPYMERKAKETVNKGRMKEIERLMNRMERIQVRHDTDMDRLRQAIKDAEERHELQMNQHRNVISMLTAKMTE